MTNIEHQLREATETINERGTKGQGSNSDAEFDAEYHIVPGYYPNEETFLLGIDVDSEWVHSATISVQYQLTKHGLLANSFYVDEFTGYKNDDTHIEHDYIFHVVPLGWLPDREGPRYD